MFPVVTGHGTRLGHNSKVPAEINELYMKSGKRPQARRSVALAWSDARARNRCQDKTLAVILADRGTGEHYVLPAKAPTNRQFDSDLPSLQVFQFCCHIYRKPDK
ncbi:hypothetical protein SAMN05443661_11683 [Natronobacterium gregoryi]|uniref:Transposase (ISH4) n=2 Tax=Natronobacterium gregoryi TaxID=44930 RepID=L9Y3I1_NATGS|nr:transposase (ISH4) [Natronobacterium gregoryi SP2]SFJ18108.1 hypothetical protein SAMN05443661_11683 [Natronobacterium gregoryi]